MTSEAAAKKPRLWLAASQTSPKGEVARLRRAEHGAPRPQAPQPALDDSELLAALRAADPSAATALHDRARPTVDQTIRRLLGRQDRDFEDIAQLAMIELVYTIDRYRGDCSLDSWISTITAHVVYKTIRRRQTERKIFGGMSPDDLVIASPRRAGREAMIRDAVKRVLVHLDAMDDSRAWTYVLHDVCGYDLKEIALITGVTVSAAQTRLVRGRRELHERIQGDPELASRMAELEGEP